MWGIFIWEKVLTEDERKGLLDVWEIGYTALVWQWDMVHEGEQEVNSEENRESYCKSNVWHKTDGQKNTDELMYIPG